MVSNIKIGCCKKYGSSHIIKRILLAFGFWCGILIVFFNVNAAYITVDTNSIVNINDYYSFKGDFQLYLNKEGFPVLPIKRINLNNIDSFTVNIISIETLYIDKPLLPVSQKQIKIFSYVKYINDFYVYSSNTALINKDYAVKNGFLEIYPVDYIPMQNKLIIKTIDLNIVKRSVNTKVDNNKMLIIFDETFNTPFIDSFALLFRKRNKIVKYVSTSITGSSRDSIKAYILNEYNLSPFSFLLLIGTESMINGFDGIDNYKTDLIYSLVDTNDYFPDIKCARLPFDSIVILKRYYENINNNFSFNIRNKYNNAYFIASDDPYYHDVAESTHIYSMNRFRNYGIDTDSLFGFYNSGLSIDSAINEGREFVFYSGHGIAFQWQGPFFDNDNIYSLNNNKFPIVFSFACLTGNYVYRDFFGYSWLKYDKKGAIAFFGSSNETYWEEDDILQRLIVDSFNISGYLVDIFNKGKLGFYQHYGDDSITRAYFEQYNYFMLPDLYYGNRNINNIAINCDKFQPYSNGYIDFGIDFYGGLDKSIYSSIIINNSIYDSINIFLPGDYILNQNANVNDTVQLSVFLPGRIMYFQDIVLIPDGSYVNLFDYTLGDISNDTFFFNLYVKNYGNQIANNIDIFVKYLPNGLTLQSQNIHIDSILPESIKFLDKQLAFTLTSTIEDTVCTLGFVNNTDTLYAALILNNINPNFNISYINAVADKDTSNSIIFGVRNSLRFSIKNLSNLSFNNIELKFNIGDIYVFDSIVNIELLNSGELSEFTFDVYVNNIEKDTVLSNIILNIGTYQDTFSFVHTFTFRNSISFIGPLAGYYIYTNSMKELINIPRFTDYRDIKNKWNTVGFVDDDCKRIELPFNFLFNDTIYTDIFLHSNGILSVDSLEYSMFSINNPPIDYLAKPVFFCAWRDNRYPFTSIISNNLDDLNGYVLYQYLYNENRFVILFNNVVDYNNDTINYAIVIDTSTITLHFYKVQDPNIIIGFQADSQNVITLNDSVISNKFDSLSVIFTKEKPKFITKTNLRLDMVYKPVIFGGNLYKKGSTLSILFSDRAFYTISLYDILGRQYYDFQGVVYPGIKTVKLNVNKGIYFILIKDNNGLLLKKKLIVI